MLAAISMMAGLLLTPGLEVRSESACPSSEAITSKLRPLLPEGGETDEVAHVTTDAPDLAGVIHLYLRLTQADGSMVMDRHLLLRGGCDDMADTVATILATWKAPTGSQPPAPQPPAPQPPAPQPPAPQPPAPQPEPSSVAAEPRPAPQVRAPGVELWLGAGAGLGSVGGTAPTGSFELLTGRPDTHFQARLAGTVQTSRQRALESGNVTWRRWHGQLGLGWLAGATESSWQASADADLLLGWLTASGHQFAQDHREDAFEYGLAAGLRGARRLGGWAFWLEARTTAWARTQRAVLSGSSALSTTLPRFDVLVELGASRLANR